MKTKTWISTDGEVFEGTQAELCREFGIKHKRGLSRPAGAVDQNGARWLEETILKEQGDFKKPRLYLGDKEYFNVNKVTQENERSVVSPSETADIYNVLSAAKAQGNLGSFTEDEVNNGLLSIEATYEVVDNSTFRKDDGLERLIKKRDAAADEVRSMKANKFYPNAGKAYNEDEVIRLSAIIKELSVEIEELKSTRSMQDTSAKYAYVRAHIAELRSQ